MIRTFLVRRSTFAPSPLALPAAPTPWVTSGRSRHAASPRRKAISSRNQPLLGFARPEEGSPQAFLASRIEGITQPVTQEIHGQQCGNEGGAGKHNQPPINPDGIQLAGTFGNQRAPTGHRRLNSQS